MHYKGKDTIAIATAMLAVLGSTAAHAQDKYALESPGGIAYADFKGYEDWAVISSARTDDILKAIVGNPTIIKAFKEGIAGNGKCSTTTRRPTSSRQMPTAPRTAATRVTQ